MAYIQDGQQSLASQSFYYDDCLNGSSWLTNSTGTGAGTSQTTTAARPGIFVVTTGTTTTGEANYNYTGLTQTNNGNFIFGGGPFVWTGAFNVVQLANVTDDFSYYCGMHDGWEFGGPSNGVYFQYIRANSTNWQIVANNSGTATTTSSSIAVTTGWHKLVMVATTSSVTYYVDGVSAGSISTNIPTGAFNLCGHKLVKTAGTTSVTCQQDYFEFQQTLTTAR
jgi:hypothetical protein